MSEPRYCPVSRKWCTCDHRCEELRIRRRLLAIVILILGAIPLLLVLNACTTPDVMCDMKADFQYPTAPLMEGRVVMRWKWGVLDLPRNVNGTTECFGTDDRFCLVKMKGAPPSLNDVCGLAKAMHEELHVMGATHEP